jgi:RNA polymerase sigma-70 factor (ECF subfamily)
VPAPNDSDENLLVEYAAHFSEDAFSELHCRHHRHLRYFLARSFRLDEHAIDDVLQEVWLALSAVRNEPIDNVAAWLRGTACRQAKMFIRTRERARADCLDEDVCEAGPSPLEDLASREDAGSIWEIMRQLEPTQRQALAAIYCEGHTLAATADELGLPLQTLWDQVSRAKGILRAKIA